MAENNLTLNDTLCLALSQAVQDGSGTIKNIPGLLKRVIRENMWQERVIVRTGELVRFNRFVDFVTALPLDGMGTDIKTLQRLCADDKEALDLIDYAVANPDGRPVKTVDNVNSYEDRPDGNSASAALRRLRKDRPDLHADVIAGKKSPHKAMVEAGFRKKTLTVPIDPDAAAKVIGKAFSASELDELIANLVKLRSAS